MTPDPVLAAPADAFALRLEDVSKDYFRLSMPTLRFMLRHGLGLPADPQRIIPADKRFRAVDHLSLTIPQGQSVGIIGSNGAGKSTLLRLMAGLSEPTGGHIQRQGRMAVMLTLGAGVHPELTGRENIRVSGAYHGHARAAIEARLEEIIAFADIGDFIDRPVRTYSSGMQARLAFAIITGFGAADVLLIDELLGAGDARFMGKVTARIQGLIQGGSTVVLVSHSMAAITRWCERAIWLEHGRIALDGPAEAVTTTYVETLRKRSRQRVSAQPAALANGSGTRHRSTSQHPGFSLPLVEFIGPAGHAQTACITFDPLAVRIHYRAERPVDGVSWRLGVQRADGTLVLDQDSRADGLPALNLAGQGWVEAAFESFRFSQGLYVVRAQAFSEHSTTGPLASHETLLTVEYPDYNDSSGGTPAFHHESRWDWERNTP